MKLWFKSSNSWQDHSSIIDLDQGSEITNNKYPRPNQKQIAIVVLKWVLTAIVFGLITFFTLFGIDFNAHITLKTSSVQYNSGELSPTCFQQQHNSSINTTKKNGIIPSVPLIEDDVCFDFASLLSSSSSVSSKTTTNVYHTFWSGELLTELELASIRSFIATQPQHTVLYLWTPNTNKQLEIEQQLQHGTNRIEFKSITEDKDITSSWQSSKLLLRLISLYKYGGIWFDMDSSIFVRDMSPLLSQEWTSTSHCLKGRGGEFDGSFMHFFKKSPFVCEMLYEINQSKTTTTASQLYTRIYYRLLHYKITTWSVLPWCFTDPSQCKKSNSLPGIFSSTFFDKLKLKKVFAVHWYSSSSSSLFGTPSSSSRKGSIFNYLVDQHKHIVGW